MLGKESHEIRRIAGHASRIFSRRCSMVLFTAAAERTTFVLCGLAVEILGLAVAVRGHMLAQGENRL